MKNWLESQGITFLLVGGTILLFSFVILVFLSGLDRSDYELEYLFLLPFLVYLVIIIFTKYLRLDTKQYFLPILLFFALLIQLLILTTKVQLSDDVYRFLLEGKMILNGLNPYGISLSEVPTSFTSEFLPVVNNSHITSPYPPLAILFFAILTWVWEDPLLFRIIFSLAFILSIVFLNKLLAPNHRWKLVIFAWNPLFHLETGNGSHFEAVIVLLLIFALLNLENDRKELASILFLATFFLKYYTIFVIPLFWRHFGKTGQRIILIGVLGYGTSIFFYPSLISGLLTFANDWYFNASITWFLFELTSSLTIAKVITGTIFVLFLGILVFKGNLRNDIPYNYAGLIIGLFLLLQPTFHPWYLFWLFPFILMDKDTIPWSWVLLSGLIILSYTIYVKFYTSLIWYESDIIRLIEYIPFYIVLLYNNRKTVINLFRFSFKRERRVVPPEGY